MCVAAIAPIYCIEQEWSLQVRYIMPVLHQCSLKVHLDESIKK